jgi:hypothetical protein
VHRLDQINAKKPAKLLDSKSLKLDFSRKQIWAVFFMFPVNLSPEQAHFRVGREPGAIRTAHTIEMALRLNLNCFRVRNTESSIML